MEDGIVNGVRLLNQDQARARLGGICTKTLYNLRKKHGLPYIKIGSRVMFDPQDVDRFAAQWKRVDSRVPIAA